MKNKYIKSSKPKVSILVPTYNREGLLKRTLSSLLSQTYKNIEIIVVNDAGQDVSGLINKLDDARIKYFTNKENKDLAGTRNVALEKSTGDYICLLDDDDIYLPLAIEFRMSQIDQIGADVVYTRALRDIWEPVQGGYRSVGKQLYWDSPFDKDLILVQNIAPCCCPMFSRKAWEKTGHWFDENLTTSEDWAFWVELSRDNYFHNLQLIDCECSYRQDMTQMTGSRSGYTDHLPSLYRKWREYANNRKWVVEHQNAALLARGLNPADYDLEE